MLLFLRIGAGGVGSAKYTYFHDTFVRRLRSMSEEDYLESLALAQLMPGPNMLNVSIASGLRLHGKMLAVVGTIAVILPGVVLIAFLSVFAANAGTQAPVAAALHGITIGACALVAVTLAGLARANLRTRVDALLALACFAAMLAGVALPVILLVLGPASVWVHRRAA